MPIEIKELTVRFVINEKSASSSSTQNNNSKALKLEDKNIIIDECVEKVLEILERQRDR